ncbi:SPX-domain-containing protein [Nadsonia fulvescens var. elongata DSM 6958]|uniref:Vacuolar transporter chaperone complex subunit 4 n=1 Tax=Nadsonia fulvescens var. elongata DSM 6958 TaxID=857566 RepID=A0A1E3PNL6_9ASCO|nr:SPX-domain-containing protein [Nadsonia fulvescens var. elongata DSM 6958]
MKFGQQLKSSLIKNYYYYYISYDDLKDALKAGLAKNESWSEREEETFVTMLETELDKVYTFQKVKASEILRRIKDSEREVNSVVQALADATDAQGSVNADLAQDLEQEFEELEEELSDIIADVHDLAKFTRLNYTGFQKIIKKHDKQTGWVLKPIFSARLNAKPFFKDNYDILVVKLSKLYDLVRTRGNPVKGDSSAGGGQQNFVRQTTKYWVHPDNITELKLIILKHLPVLVFNASKEFQKEDSAITSIYYDNKQLDLYRGRLEKTEGAEAVRLRWYGGMQSDQIFIERKTHREDWTGEKSVKARFALKEKYVNEFMAGKYTVPQAFDKIRREGKKSLAEIESLEALAREVQYATLTKKLRPVVRSFYNRTAFQLPGDARVRISLDTELTMVREDNFDSVDRTHGNWRRMDIGVDWPFSQLPAGDVERFPYAVLEVKLQTQMGQEPPQWVRELVSSHLVEAVPKFSKFIHGCATLLPERVDLIPFWMPQMTVDIRKPANTQYGIERPQHSSSVSGAEDYDDDDFDNDDAAQLDHYRDEEDGVGSSANVQFNRVVEVHDTDEQTPLLLSSSSPDQRRKASYVSPKIRRWLSPITSTYASFVHWVDEAFLADISVSTIPQGTQFISNIVVPAGKRISVPVRIEPKVYFANERTFLSWVEIGTLLGGIAIALLNYGDHRAIDAAVGFFFTSVITILYAIAMYIWRVYNIRNKRAVRYDDQVGPTVICISLAAATGINFIMRATS